MTPGARLSAAMRRRFLRFLDTARPPEGLQLCRMMITARQETSAAIGPGACGNDAEMTRGTEADDLPFCCLSA